MRYTSYVICRQCSRTKQAKVELEIDPNLMEPARERRIIDALNREFRRLGWRISDSDMGEHLCPRCKAMEPGTMDATS